MNGVDFELILLIAFALGIFVGKANAQGGLYLGVEVSNSSRSFKINSDLQDLKGAKIMQQGRTYAITAGSRLINGRIRLGNFNASNEDSKPMQSNTFELGSTFSPLQLIAKRTPILEPYIMMSLETTKIKSTGTYTPPVAKASTASTCPCQCPSANTPPDPEVASSPVPFSGDFGSTKANVGVGLKAHIQKGKLFLNVFGEMNYGLTLGTTASTQALLNTYVLNQVAFNTGITLGYIYTKTGHRLRNVSFR